MWNKNMQLPEKKIEGSDSLDGTPCKMSSAIGIDLGTTNCRVAVSINGEIHVVNDALGQSIVPSYAAFDNGQWLVGEEAKATVTINPRNTVFNVKRIIGKRFTDADLQKDIGNYPFLVFRSPDVPKIVVSDHRSNCNYLPEEISAKLLIKMKEMAETHLGIQVTGAVITVPACFSNSQREATRRAGRLAGLNILRILNEPTAVALAHKEELDTDQKILVVDFGGGKLDISIFQVCEGHSFTVLSTCGDTRLGGEDIDQLLVDHFVTEFKQEHSVNLKNSPIGMQRLRSACEKAKCALSDMAAITTRILVEDIHGEINLDSELTRDILEVICEPILSRMITTVRNTLKSANLSESDIDRLILTGGCSRIPNVRKNIMDLFSINPVVTTNFDEAVVRGAAVLAMDLTRDPHQIEIREVLPFSLGLSVGYINHMTVFLAKNTCYPATHAKSMVTICDDQTCILFSIYQGERPLVRDNHLLDSFKIADLVPLPAGEVKFEVTFSVDSDGILLGVKAIDMFTRIERSVQISRPVFHSPVIQQVITEASLEEDNVTRANIGGMELFNCYMRMAITLARTNAAIRTALSNAATVVSWWEANQYQLFDREVYVNKLSEARRYLDTSLGEDSEVAGGV